jgi:argininosuccinate lyase
MPQKRNPAALEQLRAQASFMLGDMQTAFLIAHNVRTGMFDYRSYDPIPCARPLQVLKLCGDVVEGIVVDKERALEEVNADYSTTTEIADALLQRAEVPFRVGHHFASLLTDHGRSQRLRLCDIPFEDVQRIYSGYAAQPLPLNQADFREIISAEYMVFGRKGLGGPQLAEVERMLGDEASVLACDDAWLASEQQRLGAAAVALEAAFAALAGD